jgi:imidazolonepropionase
MTAWDAIWINARLATMQTDGAAAYGAVEDGALAVQGDRIVFAGPRRELPGTPESCAKQVIDAGARWITPGLIDCHTHIVFGGDRSGEFEQRLNGATYEEIARAGGGIRSTVKATRTASENDLVAAASARVRALMAQGVTTIEIKSGYGLDLETEMKMLRVARRLAATLPIDVSTSFLGAHALPPEYEGRQGDYVTLVCEEMIPAVAKHGLADAVDAFGEKIAFTPEETERVFAAARAHKIPVRLHADQLSDQGGAALAARYRALSADHLEHTSPEGIAALAAAGTVAVLLPGAFYFLRETKLPPIQELLAAGVPVAIASDCNPGSSPALSLLLMLNMACTLFRLRPEQALSGVTRNAALALGLRDRGTLAAGQRADFVLWDISRPADLCYWIGGNPCSAVIRAGKHRA